METHTQATPETINARLTLDVTYLLTARLRRKCWQGCKACANTPLARGC